MVVPLLNREEAFDAGEGGHRQDTEVQQHAS